MRVDYVGVSLKQSKVSPAVCSLMRMEAAIEAKLF